MRTVEVLQLVSALGGAVATFIAAMELRVVKLLKKAGALTPETAMEEPTINRVMRWRLKNLIQRSIVRITGEGRIYLDEEKRSLIHAARRKRVLAVILPMLILVVLLIIWLHRDGRLG